MSGDWYATLFRVIAAEAEIRKKLFVEAIPSFTVWFGNPANVHRVYQQLLSNMENVAELLSTLRCMLRTEYAWTPPYVGSYRYPYLNVRWDKHNNHVLERTPTTDIPCYQTVNEHDYCTSTLMLQGLLSIWRDTAQTMPNLSEKDLYGCYEDYCTMIGALLSGYETAQRISEIEYVTVMRLHQPQRPLAVNVPHMYSGCNLHTEFRQSLHSAVAFGNREDLFGCLQRHCSYVYEKLGNVWLPATEYNSTSGIHTTENYRFPYDGDLQLQAAALPLYRSVNKNDYMPLNDQKRAGYIVLLLYEWYRSGEENDEEQAKNATRLCTVIWALRGAYRFIEVSLWYRDR